MFVPTSSGIDGLCQLMVPVHLPDPDVELVQVTLLTPTLSEAVPEITMLAAAVATFVPDGDVIVNVGGVLSGVDCGGGDDCGGVEDGGAGAA